MAVVASWSNDSFATNDIVKKIGGGHKSILLKKILLNENSWLDFDDLFFVFWKPVEPSILLYQIWLATPVLPDAFTTTFSMLLVWQHQNYKFKTNKFYGH